MAHRIVTQHGWELAVEPTRDRQVELLIVTDDAPKGGRLFFDRLAAGMLADSITTGLRPVPTESAQAEPAPVFSIERWSAIVDFQHDGSLKLSLIDEMRCSGNFLYLDRLNAGLLAEALLTAIS